MFQPNIRKSPAHGGIAMMELIFHAAVRNVRKSHGNAVIGLLLSIIQSVVLVGCMLFMFHVMGSRGNGLRGDFVLYLLSGVFLFMVHSKAMSAVMGADGPTSPMMKHSPMNTIVSISAAALGALYLQVLSAAVILFLYHAVWTPITIADPVGMIAMFLLAWISGVALGMVVKAATPWQPEAVGILGGIYIRLNIFASGKMFVVNKMPPNIRAWFEWNPLFHLIDQERGFVFLDYIPRYTSIRYAVIVTVVAMVIGLMGEFYTRKFASVSWSARR